MQVAVFGVDAGIVGDESSQRFDDVEHGVTTFDDLCLAVGGHRRARVALFGCQLSETGQDVELSDVVGVSFEPRGVSSGEFAELIKDLSL